MIFLFCARFVKRYRDWAKVIGDVDASASVGLTVSLCVCLG